MEQQPPGCGFLPVDFPADGIPQPVGLLARCLPLSYLDNPQRRSNSTWGGSAGPSPGQRSRPQGVTDGNAGQALWRLTCHFLFAEVDATPLSSA
jgi:hypothetical protein